MKYHVAGKFHKWHTFASHRRGQNDYLQRLCVAKILPVNFCYACQSTSLGFHFTQPVDVNGNKLHNTKCKWTIVFPESFKTNFILGRTSHYENIIIEHCVLLMDFPKEKNSLNICFFVIILSEIFSHENFTKYGLYTARMLA